MHLQGLQVQDNVFNVEFYGAFSTIPKTVKEKIISTVRKIAVALHLIPKTMKGKELLNLGIEEFRNSGIGNLGRSEIVIQKHFTG